MGASTTGRASRRHLRVCAAVCAVAVGALAGLSGGVLVPAASAADGALTFAFAAENSGLSRPGEDLVVSGTVTNLSDSAVAASVVDIAVVRETVDTDELSDAFADPAGVATVPVGSIDIPQLPVAGSAQLSVTLPAAAVDGAVSPGWGAHPVVATLRDDPTAAQSVSALVRLDGDAPASLEAALILPITTPPSIDGLISAEILADYTSPTGVLTRRLDAATDPRVTLALDPRILASIRVLGSEAPDTAVEWLDRLEAMPNQVFPLAYGDADLSLERSAGAPGPLQPTSFAAALDPADFPAQPSTPTTTATPDGSPSIPATTAPVSTPTPTETAPVDGTVTLPTTDELLRFDYTATDISWPSGGAVAPADLDFAEQAGLDRAIVSESQLDNGDADSSPVAAVDGHTVLVADPVAGLISDAVFASGAADARVKASRASAALATAAGDLGSGTGRMILPLSRSAAPGMDAADVLRSLSGLPWLTPAALETVVASSTAEEAALAPAPDDRADTAASLLADEAAISSFASVLDRPELLTGTARLDLLAALGAGWAEDREGWGAAVADLHTRTRDILGAISIDPSSQINVASFTADTPVSVTNALPYPVNIVVTPTASNGRLVISGGSATIDANSTQRVLMQARAVGNGRVSIEVRMSSPNGVPIGTPRYVQLDVQPYWETAGIAVMGAVVVFLLGFGTYRSIRRRRRGPDTEKEASAGEAVS